MALFSLGSFATSGVIDVNLESSSVSCFFLFACLIWFLFHLDVNNANRHIPLLAAYDFIFPVRICVWRLNESPGLK